MLKSIDHISQLLDQIGMDLSKDRLHELIQEAHDNERPLPAHLAEHLQRKEDEFLTMLATAMELPFERLKEIEIESTLLDSVPPKAIFQYNTIPVREENQSLLFATADPFAQGLIDASVSYCPPCSTL